MKSKLLFTLLIALLAFNSFAQQIKPLTFDSLSRNPAFKFWYEQQPGSNEYLTRLINIYRIDTLVKSTDTDSEKALKVMNWVHKQWSHNGSNEPSSPDALTILKEAKEGKKFRCVEYGITTAACLNALGLKSRRLGLKMESVETVPYGAGHVCLEVYLNDLKKWVFLDGQWDAMPVLNGVPLNAVEFQRAIVQNSKGLKIQSLSGTKKKEYINWIKGYLFYLDVKFDNREIALAQQEKINDKKNLMLVPVGAKEPTIFQVSRPLDYCLYTNSVKDFYSSPE